MHRLVRVGYVGVAAAVLLFAASPASAGIFDVLDKVDKRVQDTEKKVDQTTRVKDSSKRIKGKTGGLVGEAVPDKKKSAPATPQASDAQFFFESVDGGQRPLSPSQAASEISKGRIQRDTLGWSEGMDG